MRYVLLALILCGALALCGQNQHGHVHDRPIYFPNVDNYQTVLCDFHQHTVFSDGSVWPDIRVQEALRDSVDVISMTEHIEYQPHAADIPHPDRNRSYDIARQRALPYDLLVVHGAEITRDMPPGHNNAIFIKDANKLLIPDSVEVFREASRQGAFVFWNHANWIAQRRDGIATMTPTHEYLIREGLLHGIEVVNDLTYSEEALQIALDYDLAIMATSDIHGLVDWQYDIAEGGHRPVTLVFAEAKTEDAIKDALFARRTVAWYKNTLIGREEHLIPLLEAAIQVQGAEYIGPTAIAQVDIYNDSDAEFLLLNRSAYTFHERANLIVLPPHTQTSISVKTLDVEESFDLSFQVLNAVTAPQSYPTVTLNVMVEKE